MTSDGSRWRLVQQDPEGSEEGPFDGRTLPWVSAKRLGDIGSRVSRNGPVSLLSLVRGRGIVAGVSSGSG
jgi:hypothetical protein